MREKPPAALIAITNDLTSPLAQAAGFSLHLEAAVEKTVSTRTYLNSLAVSQLVALAFSSESLESHFDDLKNSREHRCYLANWDSIF
jgi:glucosamine--fructose-6-phosphate aminotransferase (isomerizing)